MDKLRKERNPKSKSLRCYTVFDGLATVQEELTESEAEALIAGRRESYAETHELNKLFDVVCHAVSASAQTAPPFNMTLDTELSSQRLASGAERLRDRLVDHYPQFTVTTRIECGSGVIMVDFVPA